MSLYDDLNSLDDLTELIERKVRESDVLEYKTAQDQVQPTEKEAAAKALSAFANTSGGVLIYGMATKDPADPERPTAIEPISARTASHLLKHAEENVRHRIPGVRKKPIDAEAGRQVLLFDVPTSPIAPHQLATDKVYYRRENAHSVPMSHDLIELYFGRRMQAILEPTIETRDVTNDALGWKMLITLGLRNVGGQIGRDVLTRIQNADLNRGRIGDALIGRL